jgi:hypothetical protein
MGRRPRAQPAASSRSPALNTAGREPLSPRTLSEALADNTDIRELAARTEPKESTDPIENADTAEPIEPMQKMEPTDPTDSTEPFEPMERKESSDQSDQRERATSLF